MAARGPYAKGIAKREEILEAALAHFAERGYDRASYREVARRVGLTQAGLTHHFASKEALFLAILQERDDRWEDKPEREHTHSISRLVAAVEKNITEPGLVRLFVSMSAEGVQGDGPARAFFTERYEWLRGQLSADVRARQAVGELAADLNPDDVASVLIAVADGLQSQWLLDPDHVDMSRLLRLVLDTLARIRDASEWSPKS